MTSQQSSISSRVAATWMEHQMLDHIKAALRVTVAWETPEVSLPRKRSSVSFAIKSFRRHLERLMALEEEGGYLYMVTDSKPNLFTQVEHLRCEHDRFRERLQEITSEVGLLTDWQEEEFELVCHEIKHLLDDVDQHDETEIGLLQELTLADEGGEG